MSHASPSDRIAQVESELIAKDRVIEALRVARLSVGERYGCGAVLLCELAVALGVVPVLRSGVGDGRPTSTLRGASRARLLGNGIVLHNVTFARSALIPRHRLVLRLAHVVQLGAGIGGAAQGPSSDLCASLAATVP